ncbi:MAG: hypothetical protein IKI20_02310 [Lachnospiraceae bacterium]|nr:hypothetical protein [Lachnospiraceae bacterium]
MKCEVCGAELSSEALEVNSCMKCGAIIDIDAPVKDISQYKRKAEFVDSIQNLMNTNLTVNRSQEETKQETLKKVNDAFEYRAEIIASNSDGTISSEKLNSQLKVYAEKGWRLANSFCNVIGKSQVAGYGGVTGGLAANGAVPITQIVLIFERRTGAARRPMPPQGQGPQGGPGARPMGPAPGQPGSVVQPGTTQIPPSARAEGDLFNGKKPTPRPMTNEEIAQMNKQQATPGTRPAEKPADDGDSEDDGKPRIVPIR